VLKIFNLINIFIFLVVILVVVEKKLWKRHSSQSDKLLNKLFVSISDSLMYTFLPFRS